MKKGKEKELIGHVVDFVEHGKVQAAYVLGHKDRRLRVLLQTGREELIPRTRILSLSRFPYKASTRQEQLALLALRERRREELKQELIMEELWEVVVDETEEMSPEELAKVYFGSEVDDDQIAAILRAVLEDRFFFRYREGRVLIHSRQEVERLKEARRKEEERLQRQEEGLRWLTAFWEDREEDISKKTKNYWIKALKDFYLYGEEAQGARETKELLQRAGITRPGLIFQILHKAGLFAEDENIELLRYDIKESFPPEVEAEAQRVVARGFSWEGRRDLRHLPLITIDGPETRDFDDALSLHYEADSLVVGIHIADVATFVEPQSVLFKEALRRGTTLYLPERIIPMLPRSLSEEAASLVVGKQRPALSFLIRLSKEAEIISYEIFPSVVCVAKRLTYQEADNLLATDEVLKVLHELARKLFARRLASGALPVLLPEIEIRVRDGQITLERLEFTPARFLVSEFMILANFVAARYFQKHNLPAIYRCQAKPRERLIDGEEHDLLKNFLQVRHLSKGELILTPEFHHGLGLPVYTTISSPIRRIVDLLMEHQILSHLLSGKPRFSAQELTNYLRNLSSVLEAASNISSRTFRYWLLKYLQKEAKGKVLSGLVVEVYQRKARVLLPDYMLTVDVPLPPTFTPKVGMSLRVVLKNINPREDLVRAFLAH